MTKLEELSEMLVSEIEQFEKTVEKLQKIQEQKILIDSRALEKTIWLQQERLEKALSSHNQEMKNLGHSLEKAKAYPVWALTLFVASLILNGILAYIIIAKVV
ncbi:hypothetical protein OQ279_06775 [Salinimicrobium sp. MT39]|uniref:Uncharacterized protein n=1 Tax=Salinimicrobium profundisediminis TaxID=2994553 RepID=A0A9X3CWA2_9FLAO|nr:DUF6730 family protein [Salinimicrobium profundisediminis]MCX2837854.1 hypothetical protein [Salinimicrobium profundisediminis]